MNTYARGKMLYLDIRQNGIRERLASGVKDSKEARDFFKKNADLILQDRNNISLVAKNYLLYENKLTIKTLQKQDNNGQETLFSEKLESELKTFLNSIIVNRIGTEKNLLRNKKIVLSFFKKENLKSVKDFEKAHALKFVLWLKNENKLNSTIKHYFAFLKRFINFCGENGLREPLSIKLPRLGADEKELQRQNAESLDYAGISLLIKNAKTPLKEYLTVAFFTGARKGEILGLKKGDIDFTKKEIHIERTRISKNLTNLPKNKFSYRVIDMLEIVENTLKELMKDKNDDEFIFPFSSSFYNKLFKDLLKMLNVKDMTLYETRHCFASLMLSRGEDVEWVSKKMLGHANSYMTYAKYARCIKKDVKERAKFIVNSDFN